MRIETAPHERGRLVVDEEPHRHDCAALRRPLPLRPATSRMLGWILPSAPPSRPSTPEHPRDAEAPDVGVEDADGEGRAPRARPRGSRSPTTCRRRPCRSRPRARASSRTPRSGRRPRAPGSARGPWPPTSAPGSSRRTRPRPPATPRQAADLRLDLLVIWWRSGHPAVVSATLTVTLPSSLTEDVVDHPEVDDAHLQLGIDDAGEHPSARRPRSAQDRPRACAPAPRGRWDRDAASAAFVVSPMRSERPRVGRSPNKTIPTLKICRRAG